MAKNFAENYVLLIPYFLGVYLYFYFSNEELTLLQKIFFKCFPIISLIGFLYLKKSECADEYKCKNLILNGLILSCMGDIFLLIPNLFIPGMVAFALAHFSYINAHGFQFMDIKYGFLLYAMCILLLYILMPGLNGILIYAVPIYSFILATMVWCSLTVMNRCKTDSWWISMLTGVGGILWMISDAVLAFDKFIYSIPYQNVLIMVTYYLGQFGLTMSSFISWKKYDVDKMK
ncbi:hypothetical protein O3M35_003806 [Rhynocoris fuscipes]|uniref:lysoplasmalogenase n=1 Tax=Rhynocoris fuscipes TaxID=488301 RepID=A0AAW1CKB9_9HEMI